ncbi:MULTISPECIES: beta strand repeat-containing protein [Chryseobacterium]|uniref:Trimeric autotransporter adhesin YadA-like head domain-containing protein n=1 Tax=Chryseobacterium camelliae TaxID=1265445 RepID=A0ABU0THK0_9FLAO|nr:MULTISPECIES: hypothetical protein [Chryseobacterium]MDQ1096527.1 hypothetical protein [Chryseobacterium camelliae]MDR6087808.1 hypothetical protein [Chryseobacterium sp. SORGH_AS_0909]MDR6132183.1 hypothetical protein [Chryseobacterium sp. SORGH_AS_1175]MDT3409613.1 hypothetical protein [Pseudacidovorax intermedius]
MKKKLLTLAVAVPVTAFSQVGINTTNPQGTFHVDGGKNNPSSGTPSVIQQSDDVVVTAAGFVGIGTISPSARLDINNGTTSGALKIADGTQGSGKVLTSDASGLATWQSIPAWALTGNSGTDATALNALGTKFIGTTDAHSFVIKTNNNLAGYIGTAASDNLALGVDAGKANTTGNLNVFLGNNAGSANTVGSSNVFVGSYSGTSNVGGNSNVLMGYNSGSSTTGDANTFLGTWAGNANTSGGYNAFVGYQAGVGNTTGVRNVAVGNLAGKAITTGSNNTFVGNGSDASANNLTNATAIGYGAVVSASNSLVLGGTGSLAVNVGIGTTSPASKLEIDGASTNKSAYNAGSSTTIDYSKSNLAYTSASAGNFTLQNIKDGGTYTLSVRGTTSGTSAFTANWFTVKYVHNTATIADKETLYTFMVMGSTVYVHMISGF